jgi:UDP-N-acetylmuramoyl-tripeptide--D-alanyl-D-alanine ligase
MVTDKSGTWVLLVGVCLVLVRFSAVRGQDREEVPTPLTRQMLDESLALGRQFLLASQLPTGIFRYRVNFLTGAEASEQNAVRQAGALWGLTLIHQDQPTPETRTAILRGLAFFIDHSPRTPDGRRYVRYPGDSKGDSGVVALVVLSLVDFLRAEPVGAHAPLAQSCDEYVRFLQHLERADHCFYRQYLLSSGEGWGQSSPYYDGEIILALVKAARYRARDDLRPLVLRCAEASYAAHARDAVLARRDDPDTKGYFQWACLACAELHASQWPHTELYAQRAIELADWMIEVHKTLDRPRNTAYAYEGIIAAYGLAESIGDAGAQERFRRVIEIGLARLSTWQVGSSQANAYLRNQRDFQASCTGGVLGAATDPWLQIDTTQHQMHAVLLARRHVKTCN